LIDYLFVKVNNEEVLKTSGVLPSLHGLAEGELKKEGEEGVEGAAPRRTFRECQNMVCGKNYHYVLSCCDR
jgi:hypothetical protein